MSTKLDGLRVLRLTDTITCIELSVALNAVGYDAHLELVVSLSLSVLISLVLGVKHTLIVTSWKELHEGTEIEPQENIGLST